MIKSRLLKIISLNKLEVEERLQDILKTKDGLNLELLASEIEVKVKIAAEGKNEEEASGGIDVLEDKIRERLGDYIFARDEETLEKIVGVLLSMRRKTIVLAESCTGGLISHRLTNVPGSSHYFPGSVVAYSNGIKANILGVPLKTMEEFGAVSQETVQAMARGIRKISGADLGLAVTGIAGPKGEKKGKPVGLVYVALATNHDFLTEEHHFSGKREIIKLKASQVALDMVRKHLLKE